MSFTLDKLAHAMRGMPRDARILLRLPDGRLAEISHVTPTYVGDDNTAHAPGATPTGARYGIILVAETDAA